MPLYPFNCIVAMTLRLVGSDRFDKKSLLTLRILIRQANLNSRAPRAHHGNLVATFINIERLTATLLSGECPEARTHPAKPGPNISGFDSCTASVGRRENDDRVIGRGRR